MAERLRRAGSLSSPTSSTATAAATNGAMTSGAVIGGRICNVMGRLSFEAKGARDKRVESVGRALVGEGIAAETTRDVVAEVEAAKLEDELAGIEVATE